MKQTAANNEFLKDIKATWNAKVYKSVLKQVNLSGVDQAIRYMEHYSYISDSTAADYRATYLAAPVDAPGASENLTSAPVDAEMKLPPFNPTSELKFIDTRPDAEKIATLQAENAALKAEVERLHALNQTWDEEIGRLNKENAIFRGAIVDAYMMTDDPHIEKRLYEDCAALIPALVF